MKATLLLADSAQTADGKLYILGGGWRFTGPDLAPMAIACVFDIDWNEANHQFEFEFRLSDEDGHPTQLPGGGELRIGGQLEAGRPAGHPQGASIPTTLALNIPPLPLSPGSYVWRLTVDGESHEDWVLPFTVRPPRP